MARNCIDIGVLIPDSWLEYYNDIKKGIDEEFEILRDYNVECQYYTVNNIHSSKGHDSGAEKSALRTAFTA